MVESKNDFKQDLHFKKPNICEQAYRNNEAHYKHVAMVVHKIFFNDFIFSLVA